MYGPHLILVTSLLTHSDYIQNLKSNLEMLKILKSRRSTGLQLILEDGGLNGKEEPTRSQVSREFPLETIHLCIFIDDKDYIIVGLISYDDNREHYKAYTWRIVGMNTMIYKLTELYQRQDKRYVHS